MTSCHDPGGQPAAGTDTAAGAWQAAGRRLKARRLRAGLSQGELGARIGYSRQAVGDAETKGAGAAGLWQRADDELAAGGELVRLHQAAHATAAAEAAAASARPGRLSAVPAWVPGTGPAGDGAGGLMLAAGYCPTCGTALLMQAQVADATPG